MNRSDRAYADITVKHIPFLKPYYAANEVDYLRRALSTGKLSGDAYFSKKCSSLLTKTLDSKATLLTPSCTSALEMAAILLNISPGDEVIMPSYTFVSTANAFVLRGATPVFVDIRIDTLNIDEAKINSAITSKTRAIVPVHYGGVSCEMDSILEIAAENSIAVVEDAAQGIFADYFGRPLGSMGHFGTLSFHETKNITSGEGGALVVNDERFVERAGIVREKGTDRTKFFRGEVNKYSWVDVGSSYLLGELPAALLYSQLLHADEITSDRLKLWDNYHDAFLSLERSGCLKRPTIPIGCSHNAHLYYLLLPNRKCRNEFLSFMKEESIDCRFHYIPLHSSNFGMQCGRASSSMDVTIAVSDCLVRLPLWPGLGSLQQRIIDSVYAFFS